MRIAHPKLCKPALTPSLQQQHMRTCPLVVNLRTSANAHKAVQGAEGKQTKTKLCKKTKKKKRKKKDKAPNVRSVAREWSVLSDLPGIRALIPRGTSHMK